MKYTVHRHILPKPSMGVCVHSMCKIMLINVSHQFQNVNHILFSMASGESKVEEICPACFILLPIHVQRDVKKYIEFLKVQNA